MTGRVSFLGGNKQFGYLRGDDAIRYFFDARSLRGLGFDDLTPGLRVAFAMCASGDRPVATEVQVTSEPDPHTRVSGAITFVANHRRFGFITGDDGEQYFFSGNCLREASFGAVNVGMRASFSRSTDVSRGPRAEDIRVAELPIGHFAGTVQQVDDHGAWVWLSCRDQYALVLAPHALRVGDEAWLVCSDSSELDATYIFGTPLSNRAAA